MRKIIQRFILPIVLVFAMCGGYTAVADDMSYSDMTVDVGKITGLVTVKGYILNAPDDTNVTVLVYSDSAIAYVDQKKTGNNGSILFKFYVNDEFSNQVLTLKIGSSVGIGAYTTSIAVPSLPVDITRVENNSVLYGKDVYLTSSPYLSAKNVTDSIINGGNIIFYKFGGNWYNLLDSNATSNAYLVPDNAVTETEVAMGGLRYYYLLNEIGQF